MTKSDKVRISLYILDGLEILLILITIIVLITYKFPSNIGSFFLALFWVIDIVAISISEGLLIINYIANIITKYYKGKPKGLLVISLIGKILCIPCLIFSIVIITSNNSYKPYAYADIIIFPIDISSIILDCFVLRILDSKEKNDIYNNLNQEIIEKTNNNNLNENEDKIIEKENEMQIAEKI